MNGRLYDPILGRFLSPDSYVQMPDFSQSFNRYSYCLNNPLKYTDPSGELFGIDDAIIAFAAFSMASSMMQAAFNGESVWKAAGLSLLSSAASYGIGSAFGAVGTFGHELLRAGAHGIASGAIGALNGGCFESGFVTGCLSSGIGSFAQGVKMNSALMVASASAMGGFGAWLTGGDVMQGVMQGMSIGLFNHAMHEGEVIKHKDGTLEVVDPLPEVTVRANHSIPFMLISEKPLQPVYPEFRVLFGLRALINCFAKPKLIFSEHFYERALERGFSESDVRTILGRGTKTLGRSEYGTLQYRYTYKGNTIIQNVKDKKIITVFSNSSKTPSYVKGCKKSW